MEDLLVKIGELIMMEIDEIEEIRYLDREMGFMCKLITKDGKEILLSLIE